MYLGRESIEANSFLIISAEGAALWEESVQKL